MKVQTLNLFCRKYDLVYVERIDRKGRSEYHFMDFQNHRRWYLYEEIISKLKDRLCRTS
jgi:hypothetical protein